ncbi:MAG TPA: bifunctional precorrin-2 dehydrogenase/sirohydrochlorin ferrochelatase [Thermoanaerobaculia bacterium]|nr:bifunctional precorrin-2 dehydrogenase/sirohydrochlorin ferrochelatase [Thermoanaerobaculia bacterium]
MWRYPIYLDLAGKTAVLIAGDQAMAGVAEEKARSLLDAGAAVRVVAARLGPGLAQLVRAGRVARVARDYRPGDLAGAFLVVVADRRPSIAESVWREAQERNLLVNTVDDVAHCNFIAPAIVRRGDLTVAISTGGSAPALAVRLRQRLEGELGEEHARFLELAAAVRAPLAERCPDLAQRRERWYRLVDSDVLDLLRRGEEPAALRRFAEILGIAPGRDPAPEMKSPGRDPAHEIESPGRDPAPPIRPPGRDPAPPTALP